jgi:hypothetical protein
VAVVKDWKLRAAVSLVATAALVVALVFPGRVDTVAIALIVLAVLPWAASFVDTAELPGGWRLTLRQVVVRQDEQQDQLEMMRFLITHFASAYERDHLAKLRDGVPFQYGNDETRPSFEQELRRLLSVGLIERVPGKGIRTLGEYGDLREHFTITSDGRRFLRLLDELGRQGPEAGA